MTKPPDYLVAKRSQLYNGAGRSTQLTTLCVCRDGDRLTTFKVWGDALAETFRRHRILSDFPIYDRLPGLILHWAQTVISRMSPRTLMSGCQV